MHERRSWCACVHERKMSISVLGTVWLNPLLTKHTSLIKCSVQIMMVNEEVVTVHTRTKAAESLLLSSPSLRILVRKPRTVTVKRSCLGQEWGMS